MDETPDLETLARALVASPHWRWMPGMRETAGRRVSWTDGYPGGIKDGDGRARPANKPLFYDAIPDLADPATLGCLLALVREAWGDPRAYVRSAVTPDGMQYWIMGKAPPRPWPPATGPTEAHALVAALLAAPVKS